MGVGGWYSVEISNMGQWGGGGWEVFRRDIKHGTVGWGWVGGWYSVETSNMGQWGGGGWAGGIP